MANDPAFPWLEEPALKQLGAAFMAAGIDFRFVGGAVRDSLLGRAVSDIDIATPALPTEVMEALQDANIRVIPTGIEHGTVSALIEGWRFEITTLRTDLACDGRHAEVTFGTSWEEDAKRRDFTINALYLDAGGTLHDPIRGLDDIPTRHIRFIGHAEERIREDYLRSLRYFRFFATHGAPPADAEALTAITAEKDGIAQLSGERIHSEMMKLLGAPAPFAATSLMQETDALEMVLGQPVTLSCFTTLAEIEQAWEMPPHPLTRLAALLMGSDIAENMLAYVETRWKCSRAEMQQLAFLLQAGSFALERFSESDAKKFLRQNIGRPCAMLLVLRAAYVAPGERLALQTLRGLSEEWQPPHFPLSGADLLARGLSQGPILGQTLRQLEQQWEESGYQLTAEELLTKI